MTDVSGTAAATAANLGLGPIMMAGKTGTAQAHSYAGGHGAHGARRRLDAARPRLVHRLRALDDPRYAMSVLVEHGGFGAAAAAPRAREIMRVALLKDPEIRARIEKPLPMPQVAATADRRRDVAGPRPAPGRRRRPRRRGRRGDPHDRLAPSPVPANATG